MRPTVRNATVAAQRFLERQGVNLSLSFHAKVWRCSCRMNGYALLGSGPTIATAIQDCRKQADRVRSKPAKDLKPERRPLRQMKVKRSAVNRIAAYYEQEVE